MRGRPSAPPGRWKPSSSGISMSSRTRSKRSLRAASRAPRARSPRRRRCGPAARGRASSSRLTRLSSTTRIVPGRRDGGVTTRPAAERARRARALDTPRRSVDELGVPSSSPSLRPSRARGRARRTRCAPNVLPFDFSVCAVGAARSTSPSLERRRASPAAPGARRGTCRPARRRSRRRRLAQLVEGAHARGRAPCRSSERRVRRRSGATAQRLRQLLDADRLGHVVVHAGGEARLAVALHRVRRHRDDARPLVGGQRSQIRRAASSPSSSGICTSISTTSYCCRSSASSASSPFAARSAR